MFRKTDSQGSLGSLDVLLSPKKIEYLENKHWAGPFRDKALPVLLAAEDDFAPLFCEDNGRPNKPVAIVLGVLILKHTFDLTDEQAIEQLQFNNAWQYALDVDPDDAHVCQKTLHNFRVKMTAAEEEGILTYSALFDRVVRAIVEDLNLKVERQRLDSTHIRSNMAVLTRLGLFVAVITAFMKKLRKQHPRLSASLPQGLIARYLDREGYFGDSPSSQGKRRLAQCAADLWRLVDRFRGHRSVSGMPSYHRMVRLLEEQCVIEDEDPTDPDGDGPEGVPVRPKNPKVEKIPADSLQGSDDDATYGHKGKGHQSQVCETCEQDNATQVVTHASVEGAHESDQHAVIPVIEALKAKGCAPGEVVADTGYGSGQNIVDAADHGVVLTTPACGPEPVRAEGEILVDDFEFSSDGRRVERCPAGHEPVEQGSCGRGGKRCYARMDVSKCADCPHVENCPVRWSDREESMTLTWNPREGAVRASRRREQTKEFKDGYRIRSGIEATNSEYKRRYGGGRLRVRGRPAVERTVKIKFIALNISRWLAAARKPVRKAA